jgi:hypothetical protein
MAQQLRHRQQPQQQEHPKHRHHERERHHSVSNVLKAAVVTAVLATIVSLYRRPFSQVLLSPVDSIVTSTTTATATTIPTATEIATEIATASATITPTTSIPVTASPTTAIPVTPNPTSKATEVQGVMTGTTATTTGETKTETSERNLHINNNNNNNHSILVVYSGPATMSGAVNKRDLYLRNLDFFLVHGVDCTHQDTIITLGHDVAPVYREKLDKMNQQCLLHGHTLTLVERDNECYDMESVRLIMHGNITNVLDYDYFVYVNCGTTGPYILPKNMTKDSISVPSWTHKLIQPMLPSSQTNNNTYPPIVMTGLSHNCNRVHSHIQSMVYALNKIGMQTVMESDCVFDCRPMKHQYEPDDMIQNIILRYEMGMGRLLLNKGYAISSLTRTKVLTEYNRKNCTDKDMWLTTQIKEVYNGRIPTLDEVMFFKTSRILTPETAQLINYTGELNWNW